MPLITSPYLAVSLVVVLSVVLMSVASRLRLSPWLILMVLLAALGVTKLCER